MSEPFFIDTTQLDAVPPEPGLYAWYCIPVAGEGDVSASWDNGVDRARQSFGRLLGEHTLRMRMPPFDVTAKGHLWSSWAGTITEAGSQRLIDRIDDLANEPDGPGKKLGWALETESRRRVLARVLMECAPRLASPIYIGVAINLRRRLADHLRDIRRAKDELAELDEQYVPAKDSFGSRVAKLGFTEDELRIGVLALPALSDNVDTTTLRNIAEAAEFVLNRWHHPLFGVR